MDADEQQALEAAGETVILFAGGCATALRLGDEASEDIATWIDLTDFDLIPQVRSLGKVLSEPQAARVEAVSDVRESLGLAPLASEAGRLVEALLQRGADELGSQRRAPTLAGGLISWIWRVIKRLGHDVGQPNADASHGLMARRDARGEVESWLTRLQRRLERVGMWLLLQSKLGSLVGRHHAAYFARMLEMFDSNQLDDALRHAIPLSSEIAAALRPPPLWMPPARTSLAIVPRHETASTVLGLHGDLFEVLRQKYRCAFERLVSIGDVEKAAFVLSELLCANEEAVSFLERNNRLRLAAEIAEARDLPPGLVIRQWFLAGDRVRATQIARRTGAFGDAVVRLESSHPEEGRALRLLWADALASSGAYGAAVDAVWPVADARKLALHWLDRAIAIGGVTGSRMLVRKARLVPEMFADVREEVLALLRDDGEDGALTIRTLGQELVAGEVTAEIRILAGVTARRLLRDAEDKEASRLVHRLMQACGDAAFRADVSRFNAVIPSAADDRHASYETPLCSRTTPLEVRRGSDDRGTMPVLDAVELPDGRVLIALGEVGAWLLSRDGQVVARFSEPTSRIVLSDHGDRAILVARRGEVFRVSRLDLVARRVRPWCDARFDQFAPDFDGATWFVARADTVYAIDALTDGWEHHWKIEERAATVRAIRRDATMVSIWFARAAGTGEVWTFQLPSLTLRQRRPIEKEGGSFEAGTISAGGTFVGWLAGPDSTAHVFNRTAWRDLPVSTTSAPEPPALADGWIAIPVASSGGTTVRLIDSTELLERVRIVHDGGVREIGIRFHEGHLLVFDCGRLLVLSLKTGTLLRDHRVS